MNCEIADSSREEARHLWALVHGIEKHLTRAIESGRKLKRFAPVPTKLQPQNSRVVIGQKQDILAAREVAAIRRSRSTN